MTTYPPMKKDFKQYHIGIGKINDLDLEQRLFEKFRLASPRRLANDNSGMNITPISAEYLIREYYQGLKEFKRAFLGKFKSFAIIPYGDAAPKIVGLRMAESVNEAAILLNDITMQKQFRYNKRKYLSAKRTQDSREFYLNLDMYDYPDYT
ncbi:MAG TPA: hypothetical protein VEC16_01225 [Alphaproteobacteria bacterium]|nr:hypothetical protein [Alphaproteobacteria bacterium]